MSLEDKITNQQSPESTDAGHPAPNSESPHQSKLPAPSARLAASIPLAEDEDAYADIPCTD